MDAATNIGAELFENVFVPYSELTSKYHIVE